jgi:hypothetical protein
MLGHNQVDLCKFSYHQLAVLKMPHRILQFVNIPLPNQIWKDPCLLFLGREIHLVSRKSSSMFLDPSKAASVVFHKETVQFEDTVDQSVEYTARENPCSALGLSNSKVRCLQVLAETPLRTFKVKECKVRQAKDECRTLDLRCQYLLYHQYSRMKLFGNRKIRFEIRQRRRGEGSAQSSVGRKQTRLRPCRPRKVVQKHRNPRTRDSPPSTPRLHLLRVQLLLLLHRIAPKDKSMVLLPPVNSTCRTPMLPSVAYPPVQHPLQ